jgi:predicted transcriptional regulator
MVSKVALAMFLDEDMDILAQYHTGKRTNPRSAELSKRSSRILVRIH